MYRPRAVITKVISRYLSPEAFKAFMKELSIYEEVPDTLYVEIMKKHFDIEKWQTAPIIRQDVWLYNYFVFEYEDKLKYTKLLRKYIDTVFIYDDAQFYMEMEYINMQAPKLPKGVEFIPNKEPRAEAANHKLTDNLEPHVRPGK